MLPEVFLQSDIQYEKPYTRTIDFQTELEQDEQTEENLITELREKATNYLDENKYPKMSYTVKSDINQNLEIGDTIHVLHPIADILTEVLEYEYDVILEKVRTLTFGNFTRDIKTKFNNIKDTITQLNQTLSKQVVVINRQTDLINSLNKNGYVYIDDNEILILDKIPKDQAKNVWRFGLGGIGFSSNGYEGPFETAITMDGQINAKFITTGTMSVSRIEGLANKISEYDSNISQINIELDGITQSVSEVETKIETVESKAENAQTTANAATSKAETAQSTADTANTNAQNAQSTADGAVTQIILTNEKVSKVEQTTEEITETVKEKTEQLAKDINNNYQEIIQKFDEVPRNDDIIAIENKVETIQTNTDYAISIMEDIQVNGTSKVKTETGYTFDNNGLTIEKTNAKTKSTLNETGLNIKDATGSGEESLLFAGYDGEIGETIVKSKNMTVEKYLTVGSYSRIEDYEEGTGVFWIGG